MMKNAWFPLLSFGKLFVHYGSFPLSAMNLLQFSTQAVPMLNDRGQMTTLDQISRIGIFFDMVRDGILEYTYSLL